MINLIVAMTKDGVIGKENNLPWNIPEDLKHFKELTTGHPVIMGRTTFESIGKPLPNRTNIVLSMSMQPQEDVIVCKDVAQALFEAKKRDHELFIIGGASVYKQTLPYVDKLCISWIKEEYEGDTYFPKVDWESLTKTHSEDKGSFMYEEYVRK